jgi:hypothetical protein
MTEAGREYNRVQFQSLKQNSVLHADKKTTLVQTRVVLG